MRNPATGWLRFARSGWLAAVVVALAAAAHTLGGGALPDWPALGLLTAGVLAGSVLASSKPLRRASALALLGLPQLFLHSAFTVLSAPACGVDSTLRPAGHPGHHDGTVAGCLAGPISEHGHSSGWMTLAHATAVVIAALVAAHGDRVLWLVWSLLTPRPLPRARPVARGHRAPPQRRTDVPVRSRPDIQPRSTRGPPPPSTTGHVSSSPRRRGPAAHGTPLLA